MSSKGLALLKVIKLLGWSSIVVMLLIAWYMSQKAQQNQPCTELKISISLDDESYFVEKESIIRIIAPNGDANSLIGKPIKAFNSGLIESEIESNPFVKKAEVYSTLEGALHVEVEQRKPLFRVFKQQSKGFYVDEEGMKMPLSPIYSARVPVLRGAIAENYEGNDTMRTRVLQEAFEIVSVISGSDFWSSQIEELHYSLEGEFTLIPKVGEQRILFGKAEEIEEKLHKLRLFYKHAMPRVGWTTYKVINLKYSGQIVCEK